MIPQDRSANAGLTALIILQITMTGALFAGVAPHPPAVTPAFGIAPFVGAAIAAAAAAIVVGPTGSPAGRALAIIGALMALVSFGPHKYADPQIALIWPSVIAGQIAAVAVLVSALRRQSPATGGVAHVG